MNNVERAASLLDDHDINFDHGSGYDPRNLERALALADADLLTPAPQIIRTLDELEVLDPETVLMEVGSVPESQAWMWFEPETGKVDPTLGEDLPAVVVATGAQVRAARTALQEATND